MTEHYEKKEKKTTLLSRTKDNPLDTKMKKNTIAYQSVHGNEL